MRRYCGFHSGRYGDLYMATVAARALKAVEPDCHLTFTVGYDYREAAPLFINQPHIDAIRVTYSRRAEGWNDQRDIEWLNAQRFDGVFNPLADHCHSSPWFFERHQTHEMCHMHGLPIPPGDTGAIEMVRWFDTPAISDHLPYVAFAPFAGWYAGETNDKAVARERAQAIVNYLRDKGLGVLQVGAPDEPQLDGTHKPSLDYFSSVRSILGCKAYIGGDTGMTWLMSGYQFPTLAFYGHAYYGEDRVKAIQPINRNAVYLSAPRVNDIPLEACIYPAIDRLLA
jgi:ADP-heptose:LPS heptosyltransferase